MDGQTPVLQDAQTEETAVLCSLVQELSHFAAAHEQCSYFAPTDDQGSGFPMEEDDDQRSGDGQAFHFPAEVVSRFATRFRAEAGDELLPPEESESADFLADDQGTESLLPIDSDSGIYFPPENDNVLGNYLDLAAKMPPTGDSPQKRKLAVFVAAGAVISIQTMLVAMPDMWQSLEDEDSADKVVYQEGLHSWLDALNRSAWLLSCANGARDGGWWVKPRNSVWFNTYLMHSNDDERWLSSFRMKRRTFVWICNNLEMHVRKQDTRLRPSIPVTVRVGATLYRLVNGSDYFELADKFGVGESSVHEIIQDCVPAIVKVFGHHLRWPTGDAMAEVSKKFYKKCGLPNCHGAVGSTHVEILNPTGPEAKKYVNKTGHFSIVLQAVADTSGRFLDVCCGFPEKTYDNKVLQNSALYGRALAGQILASPVQSINGGFKLRPYLLGSPKYPLFPWLMVPYSSTHLSYCQEQFIHHLEQGRLYTQQAFDLLKRVFNVLGVGIRGRLELAPTIVQACCLLHNILIRRKEVDVEMDSEKGSILQTEDPREGSVSVGDNSSLEIRNQLAEFLVWDG